jgi:hypothetical protein
MAEKTARKNRADRCYSTRQGVLKGTTNQNLMVLLVYSAYAWICVLLVTSLGWAQDVSASWICLERIDDW